MPKTVWRHPSHHAPDGELEITSDPVLAAGAPINSKYTHLFCVLQVGQCIKCESGWQNTSRVAKALREWHKTRGRVVHIKTCANYRTDGKGRVWLMEIKDA